MNNDNTDTIVISHIGSIYELFDPRYIRIGREPARIILNMSLSTFQRREKDDPEFPKGSKSSLKHGAARNYILQDVYNINKIYFM